MFTKIDDWLLESNFQKVADWFRDRYGRTPFWLGSMCILLYVGFMLFEGIMKKQGPWAFAFDGFFVLIWLSYVWYFDRMDALASTFTTAVQSPLRHNPIIKFLRLFLAFTIVLDLFAYADEYFVDSVAQKIALAETGQDLMAFAAYYFVSCDIKPPRPRKSEKQVEMPADGVTETG